MSISESIEQLKAEMRRERIEPERGLGQELFLFASTMMPVVNVDLLVVNERGEFLLSWRDDSHCGRGWHIPGGCVRLNETLAQRVEKTARNELGITVEHDSTPAWVFEIFSNEPRDNIADQRERSHFISLVFACRPKEPVKTGGEAEAPRPGELRWFSQLPPDLLAVQDCYREHWADLQNIIWRK